MLSTFFRFITITVTLFRYGLDGEIDAQLLPWYARPFVYLLPGRYLFKRQTRGVRIRNAFEKLGPVFIKLGQLLSTRPDIVPADIFAEISALQDQVAPFNSEKVHAILNSTYHAPAHSVFKSFDDNPLASASIAQVHTATLHSGEDVVIKILRPNIEKIIKRDLNCLRVLAFLFTHLHPDGKRVHPLEIVNDYSAIIHNELDFQHEAANTALLREHFLHSDDLYVPPIFWDYSTKNVLCMLRIYGIPVGNIAALTTAGVDFKKLSERAVRIFFTQLLENNFFHADMHPGNIFIDVSNPQDAKFIALDCAIMGSLAEHETITLARLLDAIFSRDYNAAAHIFIRSGWVNSDTTMGDLAAAIRTTSEPIFSKPIDEISFSEQLITLFATGRRFNMQIQPSLILLQKTLFNIEGLGKQLYPQLDLWQTAQPFIKQWLKKRYSPLNVARRTRQFLPLLFDRAPHIIEHLLQIPSISNALPTRSSWKKPVALIAASCLALLSIYDAHTLSNLSNGIWLIGGFVLSWLWFS